MGDVSRELGWKEDRTSEAVVARFEAVSKRLDRRLVLVQSTHRANDAVHALIARGPLDEAGIARVVAAIQATENALQPLGRDA